MATSQPAEASLSAVARPMPREPPVMNAVLPASGWLIFVVAWYAHSSRTRLLRPAPPLRVETKRLQLPPPPGIAREELLLNRRTRSRRGTVARRPSERRTPIRRAPALPTVSEAWHGCTLYDLR